MAQGVTITAQAVGVVTGTTRGPERGGGRTEARLVQPVAMAHGRWLGGRLRLRATLNLEGLTIPGGELAPGNWGEGFVDRRHPHTWAHEAMLAWVQPVGAGAVSFAAGKGFVPYGTDDPMVRPFTGYPVNHHLAQLLERAVAIAGARAGPLTLEAALFNGDEPERWQQWPRVARFGDSWSLRGTVRPAVGVELQLSHARVASPENRGGAGFTKAKWSASVRGDGTIAGRAAYGLLEVARTSEARAFFVHRTVLGEGALRLGAWRVAARGEWSERPEEERSLGDPFRSLRPHLGEDVLGVTRWLTGALQVMAPGLPVAGRAHWSPFVEGALSRVSLAQGVVFDPAAFYGGTTIARLSAGARLDWGGPMHRMGRYGVQDEEHGHGH
ncbi:MAG: hypothetical protein NW201_07840 [Gemmatimonadales bacterium]|nr:hypothetical protein [Gemmatimonadales bacterium]